MKLKIVLNLAIVIGIVMGTVGREAQAKESLYQAYLDANCWGGETGVLIGKGEMLGGAMIWVGSTLGPVVGPGAFILSGLIAADGVGRQIGGQCAGLLGLDDVVLAPTLGMADSGVGVAKAVYDRLTSRSSENQEEATTATHAPEVATTSDDAK